VRRASLAVIVPYVVSGLVLAVAVLVLGDELARHLRAIETWMDGLGPWALVVFVLLYTVFSSVFVPDLLFGIVAGVSFGFWRGLLAVAGGALAGAAFQFLLSRHLLRARIVHALGRRPALAAILAAVRSDEFRLQVLIRLTPMNRALTSYALGAVGAHFWRFLLACGALLPSLALEVYFGIAGRHVVRMAGRQGHALVLHDIALALGLVAAVAAMALIARTARRALDAAALGSTGRPIPRDLP
jgi:uncharacterized membrane protein YdjX (TVP38/TMEM64 family)